MKKIALLILVIGSMLAFNDTKAQVTAAKGNWSGTTTNPTVLGENAVLNATVDTLTYVMSGAYNKVMTVQVRVLKAASGGGTIAGTVRIYGSNYGTVGTWDSAGDTLTLANQSVNSHTWTITEPSYRYYMILQSGGTTMAGTMSANTVGIKPN